VSRNPYEVLGVRPGAAQAEIHRSFRRLAKRYHPDVNPGPDSGERFLEIQAAYEVLSNPQARLEYDRELGSRSDFRWDPPSVYDGPSHKVRVPRGYVDVASPFGAHPRADLSEARILRERRRLVARVWRAYVALVLLMVAGTVAVAVHLASIGLGIPAVVTAVAAGMMAGLLFVARLVKETRDAGL